MTNAVAYKVHVKLGQSEFNAEGPEETVKEQLAHFYIAASQPLASPANGNGNGKHATAHANGNGNGNGNGAEVATLPDAAPDLELRTHVDPKIIGRLFKKENGVIVLRALPKSEERNGEALLLILWGNYVLDNVFEVTGKELVNSICQSGISLGRVDETLDKRFMKTFVTSGGSGRRRYYSLSNTGVNHAANLAAHIFE